jgi:hypothetical protein
MNVGDKIAEIRARHERDNRYGDGLYPGAHKDRAALLAEVSRLRAENARFRAQVAEYFSEPATHPVEREE